VKATHPAPSSSPRPQAWRAPLLLWLLALALCGWQISRTTFTADLSAFLPANPDAQQRVLIEQLQSGLPARTLLIAIEGGNTLQRANASRALAGQLKNTRLFEQVQNGQTDSWAPVGDWLFTHRYLLSPAVDAQRFTVAGLREGFAQSLSLLGTPAGNALKPLLERDPTGETTRIAEALIPTSAPRSEEGVWVSRSTEQGTGTALTPPRALLVASTVAPGADLDAQAVAIAAVQQAFATVAAADSVTQLTLQISGAPVFGVQSRAQIEKEIHWLAAAGTAIMSTLLLLAFASLRALALALLPVATGVVVGMATVSLVFGGVHGITLGFGTTLIGEAVDYAIYYLIQARQGGWRHWLKSGWPTVRLGLLTSVCGFGALVFSGFPGLSQLGVFSLAGLLGAAAFTRWVMPVLMPHGTTGRGLRGAMGRFSHRAVAVLPRLRWPVLVLAAGAVLLLLQRGGLWQAELSSLSPISKEALALDASLRADLSAGDARTLVVVQASDLQRTLLAAESAAAQLDTLADSGAIGGYDSVTRWLPSLATQQRRQTGLPSTAALQTAVQEAAQGTPLKAERLAPFLADVQQARSQAPITRDSLRGTALWPVVDALLLQRADGSWAALLPLQPAGTPLAPSLDTAAVRKALGSDQPGAANAASTAPQVIEIGAELTRLYARYLGEAQNQALLGALGVVVLMGATLRSPRRLLAVCQPLLLAVVLTMGTLAALGVQLGILHLVGLLLVVAVGSNYALFFDMLQQGAAAAGATPTGSLTAEVEDTLASLLLANLTTVLGFGLIALSAIPALSAIGRVVALGALLALVLSAVFIPALQRAPSRQQAPA
jgi:predicted exporter